MVALPIPATSRTARKSRRTALSWDSVPAAAEHTTGGWGVDQGTTATLDVAVASLRRALETLSEAEQKNVVSMIPVELRSKLDIDTASTAASDEGGLSESQRLSDSEDAGAEIPVITAERVDESEVAVQSLPPSTPRKVGAWRPRPRGCPSGGEDAGAEVPVITAEQVAEPEVAVQSLPPSTPSKVGAWRPRRRDGQEDRPTALKRQVQGLLNKIAPDNLATISQKLVEIPIHSADEMQLVIDVICKKAVREPHYVATYADMVAVMGSCYPEFPGDESDKRPRSFTRMVVNTVQAEYQTLPATLQPTEELLSECNYDTEEISLRLMNQKKMVMSNMKLIGHLYLRRLLSVRIIQCVAQELLFCESKAAGAWPEEHFLECMCELLTAVGFAVDDSEKGQSFMTNCIGRLKELRTASKLYCKRVQLLVQDVIDLRAAGWKRKAFRAPASTKAEVRKEAKGETGNEAYVVEIAGKRSNVADKVKVALRPHAVAVQ